MTKYDKKGGIFPLWKANHFQDKHERIYFGNLKSLLSFKVPGRTVKKSHFWHSANGIDITKSNGKIAIFVGFALQSGLFRVKTQSGAKKEISE